MKHLQNILKKFLEQILSLSNPNQAYQANELFLRSFKGIYNHDFLLKVLKCWVTRGIQNSSKKSKNVTTGICKTKLLKRKMQRIQGIN